MGRAKSEQMTGVEDSNTSLKSGDMRLAIGRAAEKAAQRVYADKVERNVASGRRQLDSIAKSDRSYFDGLLKKKRGN